MSSLPRPTVRSLVICERVQPDATNPRQWSLLRVVATVRPKKGSGYPVVRPELGVFAQLTECRGRARMRVEIRHEDTDIVVLRTPDRVVTAPNDPLMIHGVAFQLRNCVFPVPGLYRVQLWYDDAVLAETPIIFRPNTLPPPRGETNGR